VVSHLGGYAAHHDNEYGDEDGRVPECLPSAVVEFETVSDCGDHHGHMSRCILPDEQGTTWETA